MAHQQRNAVIFAGLAAALITTGIVIHKARSASGDPGNGNGCCNGCNVDPPNACCISRVNQSLVDVANPNSNFFIITVGYLNNMCDDQPLNIIAQVTDVSSGEVEVLQVRSLFVKSKEAEGFEWRFIFPDGRRKTVDFFVWEAPSRPIPMAKKLSVTVN